MPLVLVSKMSISFGVHLGRTSMCLAAEKDGKFDVIANEGGDFITPTVYGRLIGLYCELIPAVDI